MKFIAVFLASSVIILFIACTSEENTQNPENWTDKQILEWFEQKEWIGETGLQPDSSIDKREFAVQYHENKERWNKAFSFLKDWDMSAMEVGRHEIDGNDVFVIVSEYSSKNPENIQHESHKTYTDIHYVVSGMEYIGLTDYSASTVDIPYDAEGDIMFHNVEQSENLLAFPGTFFIFFPGTIHSPGIKVKDNSPVKKIVVKIKS